MDDLTKRRLDRALGEINHMTGMAPAASKGHSVFMFLSP